MVDNIFIGKKWINIFKIPIVLVILFTILFVWPCQFKCFLLWCPELEIVYTFDVYPIYLKQSRLEFKLLGLVVLKV